MACTNPAIIDTGMGKVGIADSLTVRSSLGPRVIGRASIVVVSKDHQKITVKSAQTHALYTFRWTSGQYFCELIGSTQTYLYLVHPYRTYPNDALQLNDMLG
jgi:hypothetical protein